MFQSNSATAEKDLVNKAKTDRTAFLQIYDMNFQRIYDYVYYRTHNQNEAEEITSNIFLSALESIERFEYREIPVAVWLYRIASNAVADYYRKKGRDVEMKEEFLANEETTSPEALLVRKSEQEQLLLLIKTLPVQQQQAIILRYIQNLSYKDISQIMDKTEGSVKQLLHRGLMSLRGRMVWHE